MKSRRPTYVDFGMNASQSVSRLVIIWPTNRVQVVAPQGGKQGAITKSGHNRIGGGRSCHLQEKTVSLLGLFSGRYGGVIFCKIE